MWQRIHLSELLGVDKVIFLDSDTVTTTCISRLWETDLQGKTIAAAQLYKLPTFNDVILKYGFDFKPFVNNKDSIYFNCGVMLIDCKRWVKRNLLQKCIDAGALYKDTTHDKSEEPAFNIALMDDWLQLDARWNYYPQGQYRRAFITHYYGEYFGEKPRHNMF